MNRLTFALLRLLCRFDSRGHDFWALSEHGPALCVKCRSPWTA